MRTKKAAAGTAARKNKLQIEPYQKGKPLSNLKQQIGELLLFGDSQKGNFWGRFESKLRRYTDLRISGGCNMSAERQLQIEARRAQIPKLYLATYEKAIGGRSRKSAMHAFCLECCGWQIKEVFLCSDLGCPLYPYRPLLRSLF